MKTKMNRAQNAAQRKTLLAHDGQRKLNLAKLKDSSLFGWSIGVTIALLGALGMSFTPVEEDGSYTSPENDSIILNLGDTTSVIGGPRRSHYTTSGCNSTTYKEADYGQVTAQTTGHGKVSLTSSGGGVITSTTPASGTSSSSDSGSNVVIVWNCGETDKGTAANHNREFTFSAEPDEGYNFDGWYSSSTSFTEENLISKAASFSEGQNLENWNSATTYQGAANAKKLIRYAHFKEKVFATVTMPQTTGGYYSYTTTDGSGNNGTINATTSGTVTTDSEINFAATNNTGYVFFGWYVIDGTTEKYLSYEANTSLSFDANTTIYAKFIPATQAIFTLKGTSKLFCDLNAAAAAANASSEDAKIIVPTANGTVPAGTYTIPSGVTLLVPYDAGYTVVEATPSNETRVAPSAYRTLTLSNGVNIVVRGKLSVSSKIASSSNDAQSGVVSGAYGAIKMLSGSSISLENGAYLYCWGYIYGDGELEAKSGSCVYEAFCHTHWQGGTNATSMKNKVFPINQYYVQNIEAKLTINKGATEKVFAIAYASGNRTSTLDFIANASSGLFRMQTSDAKVVKRYNPITDRLSIEFYGETTMNGMTVYTINSTSYVLPVTNNMDIAIRTGGKITISEDVCALPDAQITIDEGATLIISKNVYIYDRQAYSNASSYEIYTYASSGTAATITDALRGKYAGSAYIRPLWYSPSNSTIYKTRLGTTSGTNAAAAKAAALSANMKSATVIVNGEAIINGKMYTTEGGANITSAGNGKITVATAGTETLTYQASFSGYTGFYHKIPITPAQLHNADGSYLATSGAAANTTITYANGHWGWVGKWKDENGAVISAATVNTCTEGDLASKAPAAPAKSSTVSTVYTFKEWVAENRNEANQEVIYKPTYTESPRPYTITWVDGDGKILKTEQIEYGSTPSYSGDTPQKSSTVDKVFTFNNTWSPSITTVSDDAIYTAQFNESPHEYNITWVDGDGKTLKTEQIEYGSTPSYSGDTPQKSSTVDKVFTFKNTWSPAISSVTGDATYTAQFDESTREYTVTWKDMDATFTQEQQVVKTEQVKYGARPDYFNYPKPGRNGMTFDVFGWSNGAMQYKKVGDVLPELPVVTGDVTYTALYNALVEHKQVSEPESLDVDINAATTTIHTGGRLTIPASKTLTTTNFVLEATADASGELIGDVAAENIYFDLFIHDTESRHWHAFTVPFVVNLKKKEGKPIQINGETLTLGRGYDIVYYDGAERAANGKSAKCWKYVEDGDSILYPGKAYMIASASRAIDVVRFTKYGDEETHISVSKNASSTGADNDGGWNGIGNPKMYHAVLETGATVCQVHDGGRIGADGYNMYDLTGKLVVGKAVYVQVKADKDDVSVVAATNQEIIQPSSAPRKNKADRMSGRYDVHIAPADGEMADHIYLLADEEKEDRYVILADLAKAGVSPVRAQMWVDRYDDRLCMNTAVLVNNQADYPLGISVPNAGEYDIYIAAQPEEDAVMYLTLDGKPVWNLSYGGYTATLEKGTTNRYGLRLVKKSSKVPTGMEELTIENGGAVRKVLVNDKVYIIRNGETYTITGQMVK